MIERILAGLRVLDLTQSVAGPYCSQVLGDMGAEVFKVERPGSGDDSRAWRSPEPGSVSPHFVALNRNKRSICVDLGTDAGNDVVARLAAGCDIFLHSMKPASAAARGFGYEQLAAANPRLVYCAISAYGDNGPLKDLPGYDPAMQAFTGLMSLCGNAGDEPSRVPVSIIDIATGLWAALGIVGACMERQLSGKGAHVQVSLLETSLGWMNALITAHAITGKPPARIGTALANAAPYELFRASDGHVLIAAANDRLFAGTCAALQLTELAARAEFASNALRLQNRAELHRLLEERTAQLGMAQVVDRLRSHGVPCSEMNTLPQALAHPQVRASGMLGEWAGGDVPAPLVEMPLRIDGARSKARAAPPVLGADTSDVLASFGFAPDAVAQLRAAKVVA